MKAHLPGVLAALIVLGACGGEDGPNQPPVASGQPASTAEDTPVTASFTASDPDGDPLTFRYSTPAHGTITPDGASFTYRPEADFHGTDTVTLTVGDGEVTATATIGITVTPVNDAPVAGPDAIAGGEDTPSMVAATALLGNDTDADGDPLTVTAVGAAEHGTVALAGGTITFTPVPDFIGDGGFDYTVSDGSASATGRVTVAIAATNDAPVATDDTATTPEDQALTIPGATLTANDSDVEGQALSVQSVAPGTGGTVALVGGAAVFTPAANYHGPATFTYVVTDGAATDGASVTVTVTPVPDAPVAVDDVRTTPEDVPLVLAAASLATNDTDADGDALTVIAVGGASGGSVALAAGTITFTPLPNLTGAASFTYTVSDGARMDAGAVLVDVSPVPDAPIAGDDTATAVEDTPLTIPGATLLANDADVDGPSIAVVAIAGATNGSAVVTAGDVVYTPAANYHGPATVDYVVSDGTLMDVGRIAITVTPVNDAPVVAPLAVSIPENQPAVIGLAATDLDSPSVTFAVTPVGQGMLGMPVQGGPLGATVAYTPPPDFDGVTSFTFTASDGAATSAPATVTITITNVPRCGDGTTDPGEACDDGCPAGMPGVCEPADDGDACSSTCQLACGDGDLDAGEQCDDDNDTSFDGCSATCRTETLFFSEYIEGSSNNKMIEIANPFLTPTSLAGCSLRLYSNGSATPTNSLTLTQTIAPQDVFVACHPSVSAAVLPQCDVTSSTVVNWNGDDAIDLVCGTTVLDIFGQLGTDPGIEWGTGLTSTQDNTLRRKCTLTHGDTIAADAFDPATEYDGFATDTFGDLGLYSCP